MRNKPLITAVFPFILLLILLLASACTEQDECTHAYFTDRVIAPTCESEGKTVHTCINCSYEFISDIVPAKGHSLSATVFAPTCDMDGYTYYACKCGHSFKADVTFALGHIGDETVTEPTCTSEGYTTVACERCKKDIKKDITPPSEHDLSIKVTPSTCTKEGYTEYTCINCSLHYTGNTTVAKGHDHVPTKIGASMTHDGYTLYKCECGDEYKTDSHSYAKIFTTSYTEVASHISRGLDISKYNHKTGLTSNDYLPLDWQALRNAGFDFVILKVGSTERTVTDESGTVRVLGGKEPTFEMDYAAAKAAGFSVGVYFYTYATTVEQARADADTVIKWLDGKQLEFPVFYDMEDPTLTSLGKDTLTDMCVAFIERLQESFYYAAMYCNNEWLNVLLDSSRLLNKVDVWYARYLYQTDTVTVDQSFSWNTEKYGSQLCMWQYAQTGEIDGFTQANGSNTKFDFNYCYKDFPSIMRENHLNGF